MTRLQRMLYWFGAGQRRWFRRWVGGRWVKRLKWLTPCASHTFQMEWHPFRGVVGIEQWPSEELPRARAIKRHTRC
jgi:hypothetical protein